MQFSDDTPGPPPGNIGFSDDLQVFQVILQTMVLQAIQVLQVKYPPGYPGEFLPKRLDYIDEEGDSAFQRGMNQRIEARIVWTIIQMGPASGLLSQPIPGLMKAVRALECHQ